MSLQENLNFYFKSYLYENNNLCFFTSTLPSDVGSILIQVVETGSGLSWIDIEIVLLSTAASEFSA